MADSSVTVFAPATVANVTCGFDVLGFAIEAPGDWVRARRRNEPGVGLDVDGDDGVLPREATRNTAGVAVLALLQCRREASLDVAGIHLDLKKGMPLASGLGSSAASSVAAVVAADALFEERSSQECLLRCAMEGERLACGTAHADNAAPSLYGGLVLVRGAAPRIDSLALAAGYFAAVVHPRVDVHTEAARAVLPEQVPLQDAVLQAGNLAALVAGLAAGDDDLVASALHDVLAEPARAAAVPGFPGSVQVACEAGALGGGLSGSGPSQFAIVRGVEAAERVAAAMAESIESMPGILVDRFVSPLGAPGARIVQDLP